MAVKPARVSKNDEEGFQVEWRGILLTLRLSEHHGLSGSIAEMDGKKVSLLEFHGSDPKSPFPMSFHESTMNEGERVSS